MAALPGIPKVLALLLLRMPHSSSANMRSSTALAALDPALRMRCMFVCHSWAMASTTLYPSRATSRLPDPHRPDSIKTDDGVTPLVPTQPGSLLYTGIKEFYDSTIMVEATVYRRVFISADSVIIVCMISWSCCADVDAYTVLYFLCSPLIQALS